MNVFTVDLAIGQLVDEQTDTTSGLPPQCEYFVSFVQDYCILTEFE